MKILEWEKIYLKELAKKQQEIANLPIMAIREKLWRDMNNGCKNSRPPFCIDHSSFGHDFFPSSLIKCISDDAKILERKLLTNIRRHEFLNDDHVCPNYLEFDWDIERDEFGIEIKTEYTYTENGVVAGYHFECPITDIDSFDMETLKPMTYKLNRESTYNKIDFCRELFDGILEVKHCNNNYYSSPITQRLMRLMSMEDFFVAMYTSPQKVHELMNYLTQNAINYALWAERENLLVLNNNNQCTCTGCYNFTDLLPQDDFNPEKIRLKDMWGVMDSQETIGISPEFFEEFCFPYYKKFSDLLGLVYWGCCEPADKIFDILMQMKNLHAISIPKWSNQEVMGEFLQDKSIVFSRKPDPNFLSVDKILNEDGWRKEIRSSLEVITKYNLQAEFVLRDVCTLHGSEEQVKKAIRIAFEEINRYF